MPATGPLKIVLIQPAYAHYRQELFDRLHTNYDVTFVFLQGALGLSCLSPRPEWKCITLNGENTCWWPMRLIRVLFQHEPAVIITSINGSLQTLLSILVRKWRGIPVVLWSESWGASERWLVRPWWKKLYGEMRVKWATARVDAVVVSGTRCREYHRRLGVAENKLFFSPQSTVDHHSLVGPDEAGTAFRAKERVVTILYFSRMVKLKGLDVLLRAFAGLVSEQPEAHLLIVGEGPFRAYCEQLRDGGHIPNVRFVGSVPNEEAWKYYRQADVFVLPCSGQGQREGWGLVVNEALSMSLPVVATEAVGCVPDLVQDGRNGYVVTPGDVDALRQALRRLVEDRARREQMGKESRAIFEEFNSYEREYRGFDEAIRFVLARRRAEESESIPARWQE
jgi:glycosyltransferase involved in cell wall biosynthesis